MLPEKYLTGVGHRDADWKVSASEIDMNFGLWEKKIEIWSLTFVYHQIMDLGIVGFFWFLESIFRLGNLGLGGWGNQWRDPGGTGPAGRICQVFKTTSKNPLGKPS